MELSSKKKTYFSTKPWPYSLFVMNTYFTDEFEIGDERVVCIHRKRLFGYCLQAAVLISSQGFFQKEKVYKTFSENVAGLFYTYIHVNELDSLAESILTDMTEELLLYLSSVNAIHILEQNPAILKWLPNGVIIRYDEI